MSSQAEDMAFAMATMATKDKTLIPHDSIHSPIPEAAAAMVKIIEEWRGYEKNNPFKIFIASLAAIPETERRSLDIAWRVKKGRVTTATRPWTDQSTQEWKEAVIAWTSSAT